tara:strand:- start:1053 stop:1733 length:681 start_codon:yes stop_codon:yes gene_type:complete
MKQPKVVDLPNYGVLECELEDKEIDYLWKLVHKYSRGAKWEGNRLLSVDNIADKQFFVIDDEGIFQNNVLMPMAQTYFEKYGTPFKLKSTHYHLPRFSRFWCRVSQDGDYQSIHDHQGIFTFVVWLSIPFEGEDERQIQSGFRPEASDFVLVYPDTCGQLQKRNFVLGKGAEGKMLFFPSDINHIVYPHYTTTEYRVALAGDITFDSMSPTEPINPSGPTYDPVSG